ncbi:MAG TPA: MFS transporter [Rhodanobacter sp.]|nr:MFS transporter [Rhodanobacter sp.]
MDQVSSVAAAPNGEGASAHARGGHRAHDFRVVAGVSAAHMMNDIMQSVILALYPLLKGELDLAFWQVGAITLTFQLTASLLQPVVGMVTDRHPFPLILPLGMFSTLCGLLLLSYAPTYPLVLLSVAMIGIGSSTFHPESSRVARLASGGRYSLAQSVFQIGGNTGQALGPLLVGFFVLRSAGGRIDVAWFGLFALSAMIVLLQVSRWYRGHLRARHKSHAASILPRYPANVVRHTVGLLFVLMVSKFFYLVSISSYYTFYLIHQFGVSARAAANLLGVFLVAIAVGTLIGGVLGDRVGRRQVIWFSILGCAPFTLALPYVGLGMTIALTVVIGLVLASAFPAIIVYAQDLLAHRIGMVSGLFYGFSFGLGGLGAEVLGIVADHYGIVFVYKVCAFLPLLGMLAIFLPDVRPPKIEPAAPAAATATR